MSSSEAIISVRLITVPDEFAALRECWNVLAASAGTALPVFASHEWFDAAWQWRRQTARLYVLAYYAGPRLAGVLPLVMQQVRSRTVTIRELGFLTVPDTQRCDLVAAPSDRAAAVDAFADELKRRRRDWDVMRLKYVVPDSTATTDLRAALEARGFKTRIATAPNNPFVRLDSGWEAFYSTRSRSLKKANNLAANRLHKAGAVTVDWLEPIAGAGARVAEFLEAAIAISANSWKSRTGNSLDNPGPQAFIRRLSEHAAARGWLSIWVLRLDGRPVAMEYQLVADGKVFALRSDFDAKHETISPGAHLNRVLLERLFDRGLRRYYMGPGNNAYKHRWTEEGEAVLELTAYNDTLTGRMLEAWEGTLKPFAARIRDRLRHAAKDEAEPTRD